MELIETNEYDCEIIRYRKMQICKYENANIRPKY